MADHKPGAALRAAAARAVDAVLQHGRSVDDVLDEQQVDSRDGPLLQALVYGTLRHHFRLQEQMHTLLSKPLRRRDRLVAALIEIGLFQLFETRVPDHAAVSATVDACRALGHPRLAGLVNAVLRRAGREEFTPQTPEGRSDHPRWMLDRFNRDWPDDAEAIIAANNDRAPMWLRVNTRRTDIDAYAERLRAAGIAFDRHPALPAALRLETPQPVDSLPGFADGDVSVQDGGAQLAGAWLAQMPRGRVLDACSAPGGKAALWLELAGDAIDLCCIDVDQARADGIRALFSRLGLSASVRVADASREESWRDGDVFDAVLLDAPCSASGVIRRHPDIKHLRRNADIKALSELQSRLLHRLWLQLKPGGHLLYVTCSVFSDENDEVVGAFLDRCADAQEYEVLQNNNIRALMRRKACGYQLLPGTDGMDGFYFACLAKAT
jgi:16S rRNA (cytosine967-C5)-methyltransferase